MRPKLLLALGVLPFVGCIDSEGPPVPKERPLVNVQVTEDQDMEALVRFMEEIDQRQIKVTLIVDEYVASNGCAELQQYAAAGHEIMLYGRPDEPPGQVVELPMLSYAEQEALLRGAKETLEACVDAPIEGFRSYHFAHNADTWAILDDLGIVYNLSYVAHSSNAVPGQEEEVWPYEVPGYDFWAVPMHSARLNGQLKAFCDRPFSSVSASEWAELMKSELLRMADEGAPLKVEFHPWYTAREEDRWEAFLEFLDFAKAQDAEFITVEEMCARIPGKD
jgi:hypothetical protein